MKYVNTKWPISDKDISTIIVGKFNFPTINTDRKTRQKSLNKNHRRLEQFYQANQSNL